MKQTLFGISFFLALPAFVGAQTHTREVKTISTNWQFGERPPREIKADLYIPTGPIQSDFVFNLGMGDTPHSHRELFYEMNSTGTRVIVPHHPASLNSMTIAKLASQNSAIEVKTRESDSRPLLTGGWSMGGLTAYRTLQDPTLDAYEGRKISGTMLYAPAIYPRYFIGAYRSGILTTASISNNPNPPNEGRMGIPAPLFQVPFFLGNLLYHARQAQNLTPMAEGRMPTRTLEKTPMIVFLGAASGPNRDRSVDANKIFDHMAYMQNLRSFGANVDGHGAKPAPLIIAQYDAPHALDWEDGIGPEIHRASAQFALAAADAQTTGRFCTASVQMLLQTAARIKI